MSPYSNGSCCSTSRYWSGSASSVTVRTVDDAQYRESHASLRFRHRRRIVGRILVAGQRAARLLGLAGRGSARLAQSHRHQERGRRQVDRPRGFRQEPGGVGRRHQGARSRAAVEQLHGAAMDLWQGAGGALGPLLPSRRNFPNTAIRLSRPCGGGMRPRPQKPGAGSFDTVSPCAAMRLGP